MATMVAMNTPVRVRTMLQFVVIEAENEVN